MTRRVQLEHRVTTLVLKIAIVIDFIATKEDPLCCRDLSVFRPGTRIHCDARVDRIEGPWDPLVASVGSYLVINVVSGQDDHSSRVDFHLFGHVALTTLHLVPLQDARYRIPVKLFTHQLHGQHLEGFKELKNDLDRCTLAHSPLHLSGLPRHFSFLLLFFLDSSSND